MPHRGLVHRATSGALLVGAALAVMLPAAGCARKQAAGPAMTPQVSVITVTPEPMVLTSELPGRVFACRTAEIRPQVSGVVTRRLFTEGAAVRAGQALYQIDAASYQAALENAQAALARSLAQQPALKQRAQRVESLLADKAVSEQDVADAQAAVQQVEADIMSWEAAVRAAAVNVARCRITAPIPGLIGRSTVTEGALVTAHQPLSLATIQQLDSVYVDVAQSTGEVLQLRRRLDEGLLQRGGATVSLTLEDATRYPHTGSLRFREVTTDPSTGSVVLRAVFPNPDALLLPGMFVRALIEEGVSEQAILIPQQGVARTPKGEPVALVVGPDNKLEQRPLTLDRAVGNRWLVAGGLQAGERIVVEGSLRVRAGMTVNAVPFTGEPAAQPAAAATH